MRIKECTMSEQQRIAEELDQRVAERTKELATANDALKQPDTRRIEAMGTSNTAPSNSMVVAWKSNDGPGATFAFATFRDPANTVDVARVTRNS
jgi:uncharacterized coiled-coil protein SlyX